MTADYLRFDSCSLLTADDLSCHLRHRIRRQYRRCERELVEIRLFDQSQQRTGGSGSCQYRKVRIPIPSLLCFLLISSSRHATFSSLTSRSLSTRSLSSFFPGLVPGFGEPSSLWSPPPPLHPHPQQLIQLSRSFLLTGSLTRSRLNGEFGARTQMSGLFTSGSIFFAIAFLLPYLFYLPKCVLVSSLPLFSRLRWIDRVKLTIDHSVSSSNEPVLHRSPCRLGNPH